MEHFFDNKILENTFNQKLIREKLSGYAEMIHSENKKYNLTGFKTIKEIDENLIVNSILPVKNLNVPRGTSGVDVGTGSGIPGVVLAILFDHINFTLIDANKKKTDFIEMVKAEFKIENITVLNERIENVARSEKYRSAFDFCITRAFGPLYYSYEFGLPLLKKESFLYIYSHLSVEDLSSELKDHVSLLGGTFNYTSEMRSSLGIDSEGLLVIKKNESPEQYPRRFPVVKREAAKCPEVIEK